MLSLQGYAAYKNRKCECESGSEENISSVFALAPTLALFSVPRTRRMGGQADKSCNRYSEIFGVNRKFWSY
jgi:hypothetical protein